MFYDGIKYKFGMMFGNVKVDVFVDKDLYFCVGNFCSVICLFVWVG